MDLDALKAEIAANRALSSFHAQVRRGQRLVTWDAIRASIVRGFELVESYDAGTRVLLLSWMDDKRPLHTVWLWQNPSVPPLLKTVSQPDESDYQTLWTNGYRKRAKP